MSYKIICVGVSNNGLLQPCSASQAAGDSTELTGWVSNDKAMLQRLYACILQHRSVERQLAAHE